MKPQEIAITYIGQTEKPANAGFNDEEFEARMKDVGFKKGDPWCSYFQELVFKEAYPERKAELEKLFSASAVQTFKNFKDAEYPINELPHPGNLVIWQHKKDGKFEWQGHAGLVYEILPTGSFTSIEGNTNNLGGREGYIVAKRVRKVLKNVKDGLEILGFIQV